MSTPWRQTELDTVRALAKRGTPADEIARRLPGRTRKAIVEKLCLLGMRTGVTAGRPPTSVDFTIRSWSSMALHEQASMRRWLGMEDDNG